MKTVLSIFALFVSFGAFGAKFKKVTLNNGQVVTGEYLETYEDRWFYESPGPHVARYILLFEIKNNEPLFHFHSLSEIKTQETVKEAPSQYKTFLKANNLLFKNFVVPDAHILTGNEGLSNEDYYIFNQDIIAPLAGVVVGKVDGQPDNPPDLTFTSSLAGKINNYITVQVAPKFYLSLVHFKENTINVEVGDKISVGQVLGQVGNSVVSYLPHLHFTLYTYIAKEDRFISVPGFTEGQ